ncbi:MAG: hypothetical protein M3540_03290 [Actinomycetota bacterium]|nr:hypothetical protein [Actinomycetota bacterium]
MQNLERLRILAAAVALDRFTVAELAAFAGANENTTRSALQREPGLVAEVAGEERRGGRGRPTKLFEVMDRERVLAEVRGLERLVGDLGARYQTSSGPRDDDQLAALVVAEDGVLWAWASDDEDAAALVAMTRDSLAQVTAAEISDSLRKRGDLVAAFVELERAIREQELSVAELNRASAALAAYAELVPVERARLFSACLADAARQTAELPPVGLLLGADETPAHVGAVFAAGDWTRIVFDDPSIDGGAEEIIWSQTWAEPLVERHLVAGFILRDHGISADDFETSLSRVRVRDVPTVVIGDASSEGKLALVGKAGALFLPSAVADRDAIAEALWNAVGGGRSALSDLVAETVRDPLRQRR